jgi:hypothetical protein
VASSSYGWPWQPYNHRFPLLWKQNKIRLLFLPAHTSHVLQPLNLGVFAPLKSKYRPEIAASASLDDASTVKKPRFVACYHLARKKIFTTRLLSVDWQAAGLCPYNPSKELNYKAQNHVKLHHQTSSNAFNFWHTKELSTYIPNYSIMS